MNNISTNINRTVCFLNVEVIMEGDIGVSVILILNCHIAVYSKPAGCSFLAFWTV